MKKLQISNTKNKLRILFSVISFILCFSLKSYLNEKSIALKFDGEIFEFPQIRMLFFSFFSFFGSSITIFFNKKKGSKQISLLNPLYKHKLYFISSISLFLRIYIFYKINQLSQRINYSFINSFKFSSLFIARDFKIF